MNLSELIRNHAMNTGYELTTMIVYDSHKAKKKKNAKGLLWFNIYFFD